MPPTALKRPKARDDKRKDANDPTTLKKFYKKLIKYLTKKHKHMNTKPIKSSAEYLPPKMTLFMVPIEAGFTVSDRDPMTWDEETEF